MTPDVVGLCPSIPHEAGLRALKEVLDRREEKNISTEDLVKMTEFVLKDNYFEFKGQVKHQISCTAIGTKFATTYACIFMDEIETKFLHTQEIEPSVWFRYIDNVFFIWTHGPDKLVSFMTEFNNYHPNIKFTYESNKENITSLALNGSSSGNKLTTDLHTKSTDKHQYLHYTSAYPTHTKRIRKQIPISISKRISKLSSNEEIFNNNIRTYSDALKRCGFQEKLGFILEISSDPHANEGRRHRRKIIWFNPPYSINVKTNIGKVFLNLLHKHFSYTHLFHKIFNKSTVKISYNCMRNINSIISAHNRSVLNPPKTNYGCNCRDNTNCPLQNQCLTPNIV